MHLGCGGGRGRCLQGAEALLRVPQRRPTEVEGAVLALRDAESWEVRQPLTEPPDLREGHYSGAARGIQVLV